MSRRDEEIEMCRGISKSLTNSAIAIQENKKNIKSMLNLIKIELKARYDCFYIDLYGESFDYKKYGNLMKIGTMKPLSLKQLAEIEELFDIEYVRTNNDGYYYFQFKVRGDYSMH